jgi:hypothetical protein
LTLTFGLTSTFGPDGELDVAGATAGRPERVAKPPKANAQTRKAIRAMMRMAARTPPDPESRVPPELTLI